MTLLAAAEGVGIGVNLENAAVRPACGGGRPAASGPGVGGRRARDRVHCICLVTGNGWHVLGMLSRFGSIRLGRIPLAVEPVGIGIVVLRHAVLN
jgi:hypothetical protein